jgi:hypothetical protein
MKIQYNEIDKLLDEISISNCYLHNPKKYKSDNEKAFIYCKALKLVKSNGTKDQYELDENGVLVIDHGGIKTYLENIKIEKELNNNIKILTEKSLKNDFLKNIFYIFIGGLIGLMSSYILTTTQSKSEDRIIQLSKLLNEKNESKVDFQKHLNDMNIELLSLKKGIDSLKYKLKNEKR